MKTQGFLTQKWTHLGVGVKEEGTQSPGGAGRGGVRCSGRKRGYAVQCYNAALRGGVRLNVCENLTYV